MITSMAKDNAGLLLNTGIVEPLPLNMIRELPTSNEIPTNNDIGSMKALAETKVVKVPTMTATYPIFLASLVKSEVFKRRARYAGKI